MGTGAWLSTGLVSLNWPSGRSLFSLSGLPQFFPDAGFLSDLAAFGAVSLGDQRSPGGNVELLAVFPGSCLVFALQVRGEELPAVATKHTGDGVFFDGGFPIGGDASFRGGGTPAVTIPPVSTASSSKVSVTAFNI